MKTLLIKATRFATEAHYGQTRKYDFEPYVSHPIRVANKLLMVGECDDDVLAAALLHDTIEDCGVTYDELLDAFNVRVANLVLECTNPSQLPCAPKGNRQFRKEMDFEHIKGISIEAKNIKLADTIDNCASIFQHDPDFGVVYAKEKRRVVDVCRHANGTLWAEADLLLRSWEVGDYQREAQE